MYIIFLEIIWYIGVLLKVLLYVGPLRFLKTMENYSTPQTP